MMKDPKRVVRITQELIARDSQNPPGDESKVARYVSDFLKKLKYRPKIIRFAPKRDNVLCFIKSERSLKKIILSPHLDTVPAGGAWSLPPFSANDLVSAVRSRIPEAKLTFHPDPEIVALLREIGRLNIDDSRAQSEWGWQPAYSLDAMVDDFIKEFNENRSWYLS